MMCWLYTGTFGTLHRLFGGFPAACEAQFPEVNALQFASSDRSSAH